MPISQLMKGLSPRVRGNLVGSRLVQDDRRSIPACAGEPVAGQMGMELDEVYPRVCGGTCALMIDKSRD